MKVWWTSIPLSVKENIVNIKVQQCYNWSLSLTDVPRHVPAGGAQQEVAQLAQEVAGGQEAEHGGPGGGQG